MIHLFAVGGIGILILALVAWYLLRRLREADRENAALAVDRDGWRRLSEVEARLKDAISQDRRAELERERGEILGRVSNSKPGEIVDDALGSRSPGSPT